MRILGTKAIRAATEPPQHAEVEALAHQVEISRALTPLQTDPALYSVLTEHELRAEEAAARKLRRARRRERINAELAEIRKQKQLRQQAERDARTRDALSRTSSIEVRRLRTYRRAKWTSISLILLVLGALLWSAVNVQHNIAPGLTPANAMWWLSYVIEFVISGFVIALMVMSNTATTWGEELDRSSQVVVFEVLLMATTWGLNAGPHVASAEWGTAAQYSIAPIMVGTGMWLHGFISDRYAAILARAEQEVAARFDLHGSEPGPDGSRKGSTTPEDAEMDIWELAELIVDHAFDAASPIRSRPDDLRRITITVQKILHAYHDGQAPEAIAEAMQMQPHQVEEVIAEAEQILKAQPSLVSAA